RPIGLLRRRGSAMNPKPESSKPARPSCARLAYGSLAIRWIALLAVPPILILQVLIETNRIAVWHACLRIGIACIVVVPIGGLLYGRLSGRSVCWVALVLSFPWTMFMQA